MADVDAAGVGAQEVEAEPRLRPRQRLQGGRSERRAAEVRAPKQLVLKLAR